MVPYELQVSATAAEAEQLSMKSTSLISPHSVALRTADAPPVRASRRTAASFASRIVLDRREKDKCVRVEPSESSCL
jgi:hypothetical protein